MRNYRAGARQHTVLRTAVAVAAMTALVATAPVAAAAPAAHTAVTNAAVTNAAVTNAAVTNAAVTSDIAAEVDGYLAEYVRVHRAPGVALVTLADGDVRVRVHGVTGDGDPVGEDTPMRIGSMSKAFTALAVLQQADAGRFDLDDPVAEVLPELRMADDRYRQITVEDLLEHRSGLAVTALEYSSDPASAPAETVARLADEELSASPGTTTSYSNAGYTVLARLVEHTSGVGFGEYLEQRVFAPLGMGSSTATELCDASVPGLARGFSGLGPLLVAVPELPQACAGNGGIVSTARDMASWLRFQVGDGTSPSGERLLDADTFAAFHDVPADAAEYGYGWHRTTTQDETAEHQPGPLIGHGGTLATFASGIEFSPVTGTGAVVLSNAAGEPMALTHNAIVAVDGGTPRSTSNPFDPFNAVVLGIAALVLLAGVVVVVRSRTWAVRRAADAPHRRVLRLVPLAVFTVLGAALPWLGAQLMGLTEPVAAYRVVLWLYPAVVLLGLAIFLAAGSGLTARLVRLRNTTTRDATTQDTTVRRAPAPRR
ncbi:serine hydrolase domain-containing protein [Promicromonospora sp. NPDC060271]|uniref:serine hydrolase domain-containing protein n=1 Tax=Promicromonospora sp. NPDC060271 TaxID=3347089 RepID=UPI003651C99F